MDNKSESPNHIIQYKTVLLTWYITL